MLNVSLYRGAIHQNFDVSFHLMYRRYSSDTASGVVRLASPNGGSRQRERHTRLLLVSGSRGVRRDARPRGLRLAVQLVVAGRDWAAGTQGGRWHEDWLA